MEGIRTIRLYHYIAAEHIETTLKNRKLKLTDVSKTNDPLEFCPTFFQDEPQSLSRDLKYLGGMHYLNTFKEKHPFLVLCLSSRITSSAMWGHYASNHKGACLVFDIPVFNLQIRNDILYGSFDKPHIPFLKVNYTKHRINIPEESFLAQTNEQYINLRECIAIKGKDWEYEQEYRIDLSDAGIKEGVSVENGLFFYSTIMHYLSGVVLGVKSELSADYVKRLLNNDSNISIERAYIHPTLTEIFCGAFTDSQAI